MRRILVALGYGVLVIVGLSLFASRWWLARFLVTFPLPTFERLLPPASPDPGPTGTALIASTLFTWFFYSMIVWLLFRIVGNFIRRGEPAQRRRESAVQ